MKWIEDNLAAAMEAAARGDRKKSQQLLDYMIAESGKPAQQFMDEDFEPFAKQWLKEMKQGN